MSKPSTRWIVCICLDQLHGPGFEMAGMVFAEMQHKSGFIWRRPWKSRTVGRSNLSTWQWPKGSQRVEGRGAVARNGSLGLTTAMWPLRFQTWAMPTIAWETSKSRRSCWRGPWPSMNESMVRLSGWPVLAVSATPTSECVVMWLHLLSAYSYVLF